MLLSFAQFEREVTAERIRDKIAQSKARGMWMGGTPPIGYRPDGRSLAIVEDDAAIVRQIFSRYTELGNVRLLALELDQSGTRSPSRSTATGRAFGGRPFSRGHLYRILSNPIYIARIDHGGRSHEANHSPIIEQQLWDRVQTILASNRNGDRGPGPAESSLLAGKLVDDRGVSMVAMHTCKGKVRYRYYVSRDLHHSGDARTSEGWRLPAREIEPLVRSKIVAFSTIQSTCSRKPQMKCQSRETLNAIIARSREAASALAGPRSQSAARFRDLIAQIRLGGEQVSIMLNPTALEALLHVRITNAAIKLDIAGRLKRSGHVMRLIQRNGSAAAPTVDRTLVRAIVQGRRWWLELQANTELTIEDLARREKMTAAYVVRIVRLAFLSPTMLTSIIDGTSTGAFDRQATVRARCSSRSIGSPVRVNSPLISAAGSTIRVYFRRNRVYLAADRDRSGDKTPFQTKVALG